MSEQLIDQLVAQLKAFRQHNPLADQEADLYDQAPIEQMARTFLNVFLDPEQTRQAGAELAEMALKHGLPYAVLLGDINAIKQALYNHYRHQSDNPLDLFDRLDTAFETVKDEVAHHYLRAVASENGLFSERIKAREQLLLQLYDEWFAALRGAIMDDDLARFEHLASNHAQFMAALEYPQTLMVCMDPNACREVHDSHRNIMRQAVLLYLKLMDGRYEQAYLMYQELRAAVKQLASLLTTLYYNYETNQLSLFFQFLESAAQADEQAYLALINLRQLNRINQLHGEERGDALLSRLEARLSTLMAEHRRHIAFVRGLQGDFYLISMGVDAQQLRHWLDEISALLSDGDLEAGVTHTAVHLNKVIELNRGQLRRLMQYLHRCCDGNGCWLTSDESIEALNRWLRQQLEESVNIRALIEGGQVEVHVQPLIDLQEGRQFAFEALGRLRTDQGLISAGVFIDRLIELKLIERFDQVMLDAIVREAERLSMLTDTLFVNVSPASLSSDSYLQQLLDACNGPLAGINVVLELTEQTMLARADMVRRLHEQAGLIFAIDDFGTGYSSLTTVVELADSGAVKFLKIDGSLTLQLTERPAMERLFRVVNTLAGDLSLTSVAEFIEDSATRELLRQIGVELGQGYLMGKPQPVQAWLIQKRFGVSPLSSRPGARSVAG